ncbi:TetR/AcrR family transcriptional regulator [Streptomyces liangshanensis]|uniref:TetR/AcrR family transcriptional regulator n=1 Tax=Streptomyces liangshanensis TaxID=2717324 RepID=A0A6G9H5R8_9ACTN|nr:TetR/AcrR family transcriptional regulator [Streptomyces liangshanensis]QIQ05873.1 TetR/AcrR family transcriptional regulator [Streptomyces liangshanensis]
MARYGKEHKQETRQRIVETAGRRFKEDGIDGSGIAGLMSDAGLTNGAFYAHFSSKEDLLVHAVADQLRAQAEDFAEQAAAGGPADGFVRGYLSARHRDNPGDGCPSAALLDEIARSTDATKQAYTEGVLGVIDGINTRRGQGDSEAARVRTLSVFALMVGTLQLSRALADPQLADAVLEQGIRNVLALRTPPEETGG